MSTPTPMRRRAAAALDDGTCVIYARISDDKAGDELGVSRQLDLCRQLAADRGWSVTREYVDNNISATTGVERPEFESLLRERPQRVVTWHTDRFVRLTEDLMRIIPLGMTVHAVTAGIMDLSTPTGIAVAITVTAWAEYEGRQKALRQMAQHDQRAGAGQPWWTNRPFGYDRAPGSKVPTINAEEAAVILAGYEALERGESYAAIARDWSGRGSTTPQQGKGGHRGGLEWTADAVRRVLLSARNAGKLESLGQVVTDATWPAIIDYPRWQAVTSRAGNSALRGIKSGKREGLLTGIVQCSRCEKSLRLRHRPSGRIYGAEPTGEKGTEERCAHGTAPTEWLDLHVRQRVLRRLASPAAALARGPLAGADPAAEKAHEEAEGLRAEIADAQRRFAVGELHMEDYAAATSALRSRLHSVEMEETRYYQPSPLEDFTTAADLIAQWDGLTDADQRAAIAAMVETLEIHPRRKGQKMTEKSVTITWRKFR